MRKVTVFFLICLVAGLAVGCTLQQSTGEGDQQEVALGDPLEAPPEAPENVTLDGEDVDQDQQGPAAEQSQLPDGVSAVTWELFPVDWTLATPIQTCPAQEVTLQGVSYLDNGLMMVSFNDPFQASGLFSAVDSAELPIFLDSFSDSGDLQESYQCTKHPDTPNLVYCFGKPMPAGSLAYANLAQGERASVNFYDPTGEIDPEEGESGGKLLSSFSNLDDSLLYPDYFGYNRDFLAGIWEINGTLLDEEIEFITANQAAASLGFIGEIKTLIGLFNVLSACQIAADLGSPLPEGCQELGSDYYQPQTDCQGFQGCYQTCSAALGLVSSDGEYELSKKELLDYLEDGDLEVVPPACTDYQYWSRSVLYIGSSEEEGGSGGEGFSSDIFLSPSGQCLLDPDNPLCTGEFGEDESDQEVVAIPSDIGLPLMTVGCVMDPDNPLCSGEFFSDGSGEDGAVFKLCAADINWEGWSNTYGEASELLTYLLSIGPSIAQEELPASCQSALEQTGSAFENGLGGVLSGLIYSGTISSCTYQVSFTVPGNESAGGSGGGQPGPSKPDCGPGLIAVLWNGEWICIPEN